MRTGECVLNLASVDNVAAVNRLARIPESMYRSPDVERARNALTRARR